MTSTFPFPAERHQDEVPPSSVHPTDFDALTDPALDADNNVQAGKRWRLPDSLTAPTKYRIYRRDAANEAWILEGSWGIEAYLPGQVPVADEDGYLWPGDVEVGEGSGGPATIEIEDEGVSQGEAGTIDFVGSAVSVAVAGGIATVTVSGSGSTVDIEDEGSAEGAADTIDFVGDGVSVSFAGGLATVTIPGGAGGVSWEQVIDQDGTSYANWTTGAGTFSSNGTEIINTNTGADQNAMYSAAEATCHFPCIYEADMTIVSGSSTQRVGLLLGHRTGASNIGALYVYLNGNGTNITSLSVDRAQAASLLATQAVATTAYGTFMNVRVEMSTVNGVILVYVDSVLLANVSIAATPDMSSATTLRVYAGLSSSGVSCKWKNINYWSLTGGKP